MKNTAIVAIIAGAVIATVFFLAVSPRPKSLNETPTTTRHAVVTCGAKVDTVPTLGNGEDLRFTDIRDGRIVFDTKRNGLLDYVYPATCSYHIIEIQERQP